MALSSGSILLALLFASVSAAAVYIIHQGRIRKMSARIASLEASLEMEKKLRESLIQAKSDSETQLRNAFATLSTEALQQNNRQFLDLAQEKMQQFSMSSKLELKAREEAVDALIKPIRETLDNTTKQIRSMEQDRIKSHADLNRHLESLLSSQQQLQGETRNLVNALRRPEVRGQWGEMTLKRLVELSGMVAHCDFYEQAHVQGENGALRPDMIIRMPGERIVIVDVKTPLDAYLNATEAADEATRATQLDRHTRNVRERIQELAGKAYWQQFEQSPDFVVLFIPGEHFLSAALERDPALLEQAMAKKVILATPTSLVALLRAVAFGWNQQAVTENAREIQRLGAELYKRLQTFTSHLGKLGRSLGSSLDHYNRAVGSFERQVLSGARKFQDMGIKGDAGIDGLEPLDKVARTLTTRTETNHGNEKDPS